MQESFWWQCSDRHISPSPHPSTPPFSTFSPSLMGLMVSVDVKHHVSLLTYLKKTKSWNTSLSTGWLEYWRMNVATSRNSIMSAGTPLLTQKWLHDFMWVRSCRFITATSQQQPGSLRLSSFGIKDSDGVMSVARSKCTLISKNSTKIIDIILSYFIQTNFWYFLSVVSNRASGAASAGYKRSQAFCRVYCDDHAAIIIFLRRTYVWTVIIMCCELGQI